MTHGFFVSERRYTWRAMVSSVARRVPVGLEARRGGPRWTYDGRAHHTHLCRRAVNTYIEIWYVEVRGSMAEQPSISSAWPAPPPYWREPRRAPPAPVQEAFQMFGVARPAMSSSLPEQPELPDNLAMLYDPNCANPATELRRLNRLALAKFVELLGTLSKDPQQTESKRARSAPSNTLCPFPRRFFLISTEKHLIRVHWQSRTCDSFSSTCSI